LLNPELVYPGATGAVVAEPESPAEYQSFVFVFAAATATATAATGALLVADGAAQLECGLTLAEVFAATGDPQSSQVSLLLSLSLLSDVVFASVVPAVDVAAGTDEEAYK
jgi:hypothetical protein